MRISDEVQTIRDAAVALWAVVLMLVVAAALLIVLGLGVNGLSKIVGTPLPTVHDDPTRVEWGGLALDLLYGCIGAGLLFACYLVGRRVLGATARARVGRVLGTLALAGLAVCGGVVAVDGHDVRAGLFALFMAGCATRVARGLPFDGEDGETTDRQYARRRSTGR